MIQLVLLICVAVASLFAATGTWSVDRGSLDRAETAAKLFRGIAVAKSLAEQNFALTGRYEGTWGYRTDDWASTSWSNPFPLALATAISPPWGSAYPSRQATISQLVVPPNSAGAPSSDLFWPGSSVYGIVCAPAKITGGLDSANFGACYGGLNVKGHRYLAVAYANAYRPGYGSSDCLANSDGFMQMLTETVITYAPKWAAKLGTDVWVHGFNTASPPTTITVNGCPQVWVYLGKNSV